jgi:hypothetical protein
MLTLSLCFAMRSTRGVEVRNPAVERWIDITAQRAGTLLLGRRQRSEDRCVGQRWISFGVRGSSKRRLVKLAARRD